MLRSIKTPLIALLLSSMLAVGLAIMVIATAEHENLYQDAVAHELDGLSYNLSSDLVSVLGDVVDEFEVTRLLLRLDRYDNVKFAYVFDANWAVIQQYLGKVTYKSPASFQQPDIDLFISQGLGVNVLDGDLMALKVIGDERLPQGYLLIVNDLASPLKQSNKQLIQRTAPFIFMVLFFTLVLAILLLDHAVRPLISLSNFVQKVKRTQDYSLRPKNKGYYEIGELSAEISNMMNALNHEMDTNSKYTTQLLAQQQAMEKMANYDSLTGLPNRSFVMNYLRIELARQERQGGDIALLFFDLDGFKSINDTYGHEAGDKLLIEVGKRVKACLREGDLLSRLAGDEFLVMVQNSPDDYLLVKLAERILNDIKKPIAIDNWQLHIDASIGIAKATQSNFSLNEFVSNADLAMYRSKLDGKGKYTMFFEYMMEENQRKLKIAAALDFAVENNLLTLHYQTRLTVDRSVLGYEALLRWTDKELGIIPPTEFIPIAEETGRIHKLTNWVLEKVCVQLTQLQSLHSNKIFISMNLSAIDIKQQDMLENIQHCFDKHAIDPAQIEFEVTESTYLDNLRLANQFFNAIQQMGSKIALDDFGTGYSSLAYLTQISIDTLKIDKQFVDNLNRMQKSEVVTKTIIDLARRLNLEVCAEGVETEEQFHFLQQNGCSQFQGYLFGKPKPVEVIIASSPGRRYQPASANYSATVARSMLD